MSTTDAAPKTNTLALVAFITAFVIPVAGLAIGIAARKQLDAPGNTETGWGFAGWATLIGALGTLFQGVFVIIWLTVFARILGSAPGLG
ncbi:hypothetical protein ARHIZOSPH14_24150 [Agromyces rhizosphaerae]|uniref:DUF4190 domain-containing protein n=1 Tax=Agromyces rhizosphaerae TaxID=88374 RepID=A0A9W6FSI0_9MICO|nr:DUF4190 domain-containing protein [Agromyces rhizosphaerae]GLI28173.1 hypothetical protein ARHIZOSPH14_24150 [Agromyces rhizosphaerae]